MKNAKKILPHLVISMLLGLAVLCVLHGYNPALAFLTSKASFIYISVLIVLGIILSVWFIVQNS